MLKASEDYLPSIGNIGRVPTCSRQVKVTYHL